MRQAPPNPEPASLGKPRVREVQCKSALVPSGICDYALNCYTGCAHACRYCYARFMGRYHHPDEPWGSFVDVKVNAPQVLRSQLHRQRVYPGSVFVSSVCDGWQPLERQYQLTRQCLQPLLKEGFELHILTKSSLVLRDLELLGRSQRVVVGVTLTTVDESLRRQIEPHASPSSERLEVLRRARRSGLRTHAMLAPLLPGLTDTADNLAPLLAALAEVGVERICVDRLNLRWGVWASIRSWLGRVDPSLLAACRAAMFEPHQTRRYESALRTRVRTLAERFGLGGRVHMIL